MTKILLALALLLFAGGVASQTTTTPPPPVGYPFINPDKCEPKYYPYVTTYWGPTVNESGTFVTWYCRIPDAGWGVYQRGLPTAEVSNWLKAFGKNSVEQIVAEEVANVSRASDRKAAADAVMAKYASNTSWNCASMIANAGAYKNFCLAAQDFRYLNYPVAVNGDASPPAFALKDDTGATWWLGPTKAREDRGAIEWRIARNRVEQANTASVLLVYYNKQMYQKNALGEWYVASDPVAGTWTKVAGDPRPATPPPPQWVVVDAVTGAVPTGTVPAYPWNGNTRTLTSNGRAPQGSACNPSVGRQEGTSFYYGVNGRTDQVARCKKVQ